MYGPSRTAGPHPCCSSAGIASSEGADSPLLEVAKCSRGLELLSNALSSNANFACILPKRSAEAFEVRPEEADVSSHDSQVWDLFPLDPQVDGLRTYTEESSGLPNRPGTFIAVFAHGPLVIFAYAQL